MDFERAQRDRELLWGQRVVQPGQLPFERRRKLNNTEELTFKLASNCVLAVGCAVGVHILRSTRAEKLKDE